MSVFKRSVLNYSILNSNSDGIMEYMDFLTSDLGQLITFNGEDFRVKS